MNRRHLMSQLAGRASAALHTHIFFRKRAVIETALVMRLRANGVVLLVPRFGLEGSVNLTRAEPDGAAGAAGGAAGRGGKRDKGKAAEVAAPRVLRFDEAVQELADVTDSTGRLRLRIFDEVKVCLTVEEKRLGRPELV
jgi:exosome complex exonuclease DIS3/RRP44